MSEKRFVLWRSEDRDGYTDEWAVDDKLTGNRIDEDEVVAVLNEQQELIEELRLQEKDKGVPVFVVREGKNPIALFFNEQRASLYCQENMANLTYQQEKWCRVE